MMKELIRERERKDEEKLMNAIHNNYRKARMDMLMDEQLEQIEENEREQYFKKWNKILFVTLVIGLILEIISILIER